MVQKKGKWGKTRPERKGNTEKTCRILEVSEGGVGGRKVFQAGTPKSRRQKLKQEWQGYSFKQSAGTSQSPAPEKRKKKFFFCNAQENNVIYRGEKRPPTELAPLCEPTKDGGNEIEKKQKKGRGGPRGDQGKERANTERGCALSAADGIWGENWLYLLHH